MATSTNGVQLRYGFSDRYFYTIQNYASTTSTSTWPTATLFYRFMATDIERYAVGDKVNVWAISDLDASLNVATVVTLAGAVELVTTAFLSLTMSSIF